MHNLGHKIQAIITKHKQDMMTYQECHYFSNCQTELMCLQFVCTKSTITDHWNDHSKNSEATYLRISATYFHRNPEN